MQNVNKLYYNILETMTIEQLANLLGLHKNTVMRWSENNNVPEHYINDFMRILGESNKVPIDQFYTKQDVAKNCWNIFKQVSSDLEIDLNNYSFIEPSAGCGWFLQNLPENKRIGIDLYPNPPFNNEIIKEDYLQWKPPNKEKYIVIGNPPFGLRGHLALQFINHSAGFADMVAFILPQLFESDGKGSPMKRVNKLLKLAYSKKLLDDSFIRPDGTDVIVSTVFQVWTKINKNKVNFKHRQTCKEYIKIYSLSDGGTPSSTRNKKMINKCDVYLPSTCFKGMFAYKSFYDLPNQRGYGIVIHKDIETIKNIFNDIDWQSIAFRSTNGALNLRSSLIEEVLVSKGYYDEEPNTIS